MGNESERPLETATFDELWDELARRSRGVVLVFDREATGKVDNAYAVVEFRYSGASIPHCLGLAEYAIIKLRLWCEVAARDAMGHEG